MTLYNCGAVSYYNDYAPDSAIPRDKMLAGQSLHAAAASSKIGSKSICEKDRKIGHRRVNEEGETSYKKIQVL